MFIVVEVFIQFKYSCIIIIIIITIIIIKPFESVRWKILKNYKLSKKTQEMELLI